MANANPNPNPNPKPKRRPVNYESVLRAARTWPAAERLRLARALLEMTPPDGPDGVAPVAGASGLAGADVDAGMRADWERAMVAMADLARWIPPPSDEEVARWLDEHKMDKYGGYADDDDA